MDFKDKVVLITGAGSGIGKATALAFGKAGARVACLSRSEPELNETIGEIEKAGGKAMALVADISSEEQMERAVEKMKAEWGRCDVVFANAGINGVWAPIEELDLEEWNKTLNVNLTGTYLTIRAAIGLLKQQGGSIVITSSVNGTRIFSNTGATAYSCTKAAQVAMAKMLALEFARWKVRVNVVCPGSIETKIQESTDKQNLEEVKVPVGYPQGNIPLTKGEPGKSEQVAQLVLFLSSDWASHITGTEIWIDGAESLLVG